MGWKQGNEGFCPLLHTFGSESRDQLQTVFIQYQKGRRGENECRRTLKVLYLEMENR